MAREYRGWLIEPFEGYQRTSPIYAKYRSRKVKGYQLTAPDGRQPTSVKSTIAKAKAYIDEYEGPRSNPGLQGAALLINPGRGCGHRSCRRRGRGYCLWR